MKNFFGDTVGEIARVRIGVQVNKWQNSDRVIDFFGRSHRIVHFLDNFLQTAEYDDAADCEHGGQDDVVSPLE